MRLVLFDIDGTLISAKGAGSRALERVIYEHYGVAHGLEGVRLDGKTDPLIVREALQRANRANGFNGLDADFRNAYAVILEEELECCADFTVLPGVLALLASLNEDSRFVIGLATGNIEEGARLKLKRAGLDGRFAFGGFGCDSEDRSELIRKAIERGRALVPGREPDRIIVIGDTPRDIEHGRNAGAETLAVATGFYSVQELQTHQPTLAIASLDPTEPALRFLTDNPTEPRPWRERALAKPKSPI